MKHKTQSTFKTEDNVSDGILKLDANEKKAIAATCRQGASSLLTVHVRENSQLTVEGCDLTLDVVYAGAAEGHATISATDGANLILSDWSAIVPESGALRVEIGAGASVDIDQRLLRSPAPVNIAVAFEGNGNGCLGVTWDAAASCSALSIEGMTPGDTLSLAWVAPGGAIVEANDLRATDAATFKVVAGKDTRWADRPTITIMCERSAPYTWHPRVDCTTLPTGLVAATDFSADEQCLRTTFVRCRVPHHMRPQLSPVIFERSALGRDIPERPVALAPGQVLSWKGKSYLAHQLVNGRLITQDANWDRLNYLVPTSLKKGSLSIAGLVLLPTRNSPTSVDPHIESCRQQLLAYTAQISGAFLSADPKLRVELGGQSISGNEDPSRPGHWVFMLPDILQPGSLRIMSRSTVARETSSLALDDRRMLGIAIAAITVRTPEGQSRGQISLGDPAWSGLHEPTVRRGQQVYWTNGMAELPASNHGLCGGELLELHVAATGRYWVEDMVSMAEEKATQ